MPRTPYPFDPRFSSDPFMQAQAQLPTEFSPFVESSYFLYLSPLATEKKALAGYIADHESLLASPFYATLSETEKDLATNQLSYMKEYLHHLDQRIKRPQ